MNAGGSAGRLQVGAFVEALQCWGWRGCGKSSRSKLELLVALQVRLKCLHTSKWRQWRNGNDGYNAMDLLRTQIE